MPITLTSPPTDRHKPARQDGGHTHTVPAHIGRGTVCETVITDTDLQRTTDSAPPAHCDEERPTEPPLSREILEAFKRAKRAGGAHDMTCRRIVRQQWQERTGGMAGAPELGGQTALFDFREGG